MKAGKKMSRKFDSIGFVEKYDPEVGAAMAAELDRQRENIELIASENFVSDAVLAAMGTELTNKYAEGYPGRRYYGGCEKVDIVENLAIERAKKLFGCDHVNVQPHCGATANTTVYFALLETGDTILGMSLDHGGHLSHGSPVNVSGKNYNVVSYGVDPVTHYIDYEEVRRLALEHKPKLIVCGASAYPRKIEFAKFRAIADEVGAYLMADIAHIAGLVAAGEHESPVPYCDVVTSTTHKTMRGPRGGMIMCKAELAKAIDKAIFPGTQGGPLMHIIAAKAVCFGEALKPEFKAYQHQIILNAKALAAALIEKGFDLVSGGTDNHLMLIDLRPFGITGRDMEKRLDSVHITANKNAIPNDPESHFITSGIRVGTPAVTSRGFKEDDMREIAELIYLTATDYDAKADEIRSRVAALTAKYPLYE